MAETALITNPNATKPKPEPDYPDERPRTPIDKQAAVKLTAIPTVDYDAELNKLTSYIQTNIVEVDAKILEGTGAARRLVHYRNFREYAHSPTVRNRIREHVKFSQLKELNQRIQKSRTLREATDFEMGLYPDERPASGTAFPIHDTVLPAINSPYAKQQTFHDYMTAHVKCWEAATRNPLGKRIVNLVPQFVLGRGLTCDIPDEPEHQKAWNDFWDRHDMPLRLKVWLRELMTYGEQFNRHFKKGGKLVQRQIDPCTIWDVVTDPEDLEDVQYYYQQYVATQAIIVPGQKGPNSTLVIRHIPADQVDHFTINKSSSEKRGRSELYAILGWLLRFKEFMNDRITINKMNSMFAIDVAVKGGQTEVDRANEQFRTPLGSGAIAIHNDNVAIEFKNPDTGATDAQTDAQMILKVCAIGAGVSEQFLGVSNASTRASALLQTEPDVKNFEDYRLIVERMLQKTYKRMRDVEGLGATKKVFEVSFPALASEDRSGKLKDLAMMEAQSWITKDRAATIGAREMDIAGYDFTTEQAAIKEELAKDPIVMQGFQSAPKIAVDPMMAGGPAAPNAKNDDGRKVVSTAGQMGYSAKGKSGRNLANTSATLARPEFTRGGERASIKGRKSAGAPLRASTSPGWAPHARAASLFTRRRNKLQRLMQESEGLPESPRRERLLREIASLEAQLTHAETPEGR